MSSAKAASSSSSESNAPQGTKRKRGVISYQEPDSDEDVSSTDTSSSDSEEEYSVINKPAKKKRVKKPTVVDKRIAAVDAAKVALLQPLQAVLKEQGASMPFSKVILKPIDDLLTGVIEQAMIQSVIDWSTCQANDVRKLWRRTLKQRKIPFQRVDISKLFAKFRSQVSRLATLVGNHRSSNQFMQAWRFSHQSQVKPSDVKLDHSFDHLMPVLSFLTLKELLSLKLLNKAFSNMVSSMKQLPALVISNKHVRETKYHETRHLNRKSQRAALARTYEQLMTLQPGSLLGVTKVCA